MYSLVISIVSHGQGQLVKDLLEDLCILHSSDLWDITLILTLNIPEDESFLHGYEDRVRIVRNLRPLGFGANHNQAFLMVPSDYFLIMNPDIRFSENFLTNILSCPLPDWGCMGPIIRSPAGGIDDSARRYPTIFRMVHRVLLNKRNLDYEKELNSADVSYIKVDWLAGMFLLFKSDVFKMVKGFDSSYFMYLEDAAVCKEVNMRGYSVLLNKRFSVIHDARRKSLKNFSHFRWHVRSIIRFIFGI